MKSFFTLFFSLLSISAFSQGITWSSPITVYTNSGANLHPRISVNRSGNPIILWGKTDTRAYFSRWNGTAFTAPMAVNGSLTVFAQSWAGPNMASFGDTIYVSMQVTPECISSAHAYLAHSYDGGATFSTPVQVTNIDTSTSRFITVATNASGNPIIAFMKFNSVCGKAHYAVARSSDYGMTFSSDVLASGTTGLVCECCPSSFISSGSKTVLLYRANMSNVRDSWAGISSDGGATFPATMNVDNNNWPLTSCPASGPDGFVIGDSIYAVFMNGASGLALCYLSHSSISAASSVTRPIAGSTTGITSQNYPRIANAGTAATAVWKQSTSSGTSLVYAFTKNISNGFSGYNTVASGSSLMNADVTMTPGVVHVVWEDDSTGSVMYMKGTYTVPSSVEALTKNELIAIYPNPANDYFTVSLNNINAVRSAYLADNMGRHIDLKPVYKQDKAIFPIKGISSGIYYFVLIDDAGKTYYNKLMVQ